MGCFLPEGCLPCPSPAWDVLFIAAQAALTVPTQLPARTFLGLFKSLRLPLPQGSGWLLKDSRTVLAPQAFLAVRSLQE